MSIAIQHPELLPPFAACSTRCVAGSARTCGSKDWRCSSPCWASRSGSGWRWIGCSSRRPPCAASALIVVGCFALYVAYRYLLRRVFVPISDASAAVLLERRFPNCKITCSPPSTSPPRPRTQPSIIRSSSRKRSQAADAAIAGIQSRELFNRGPLIRAVTAAVVLVISIGVFASFSRDVFGFWLERIALSDEPWPRRVQLEVVGFPPDAAGQRTHKLAQDDDFELLVHANTDGYEVPDEVEIRFRLADGRRGRDTMIRVGDAAAEPRRVPALPLRVQARRRRHGVRRRGRRRPRARFAAASRRSAGAVRDRARMRLSRILGPRAAPTCPSPAACESRKARSSCFTHRRPSRSPPHAFTARKTNKILTLKLDSGDRQKLRWEYGTLADDDVLS